MRAGSQKSMRDCRRLPATAPSSAPHGRARTMSDIPFPTVDSRRSGATRDLLAGIRRRSTEHLQTVLARVFARADDWLFDMAKKDGVPDGSPHLYAMRALRTGRAPIERGFRTYLDEKFSALERRAGFEPTTPVRTELALVEEGEL